MAWLEAIVITSARHRAEVESALTESGARAVTLRDAGRAAVFEPAPGTTPEWPELEVSGLFPEPIDADALRARLMRRLPAGTIQDYRHRQLAEQDWERAWLKDFEPLTFGQRLCICPTHATPPADHPALVWLDPGLAFGTGTHASTALCLQALATMDLDDKRVIDYGCGSGILSLAALKLGASEVWALDHDPQALAATGSNAERNGVADRLHRVADPRAIEAPADVLVANILADVLCRLAPTLAGLVRPAARLLLAGILSDQRAAVHRAYEPAFGGWRTSRREDWVLLSASRR